MGNSFGLLFTSVFITPNTNDVRQTFFRTQRLLNLFGRRVPAPRSYKLETNLVWRSIVYRIVKVNLKKRITAQIIRENRLDKFNVFMQDS